MKAVVYERYGPPEVLQIQEVPKPAPNTGEVLIKIHATTVHIGDVRMRIPDPFLARLVNGLLRPRRIPILGMELAGEVEALGQGVRRFQPGDPVFAFAGFKFGAYAEYICLPEAGSSNKGLVAHKPVNMRYEQAAAVPGGGITALSVLRKARIQPGQQVLIYGASGSVGTYAVQLAKHFGAQVTGVCSTGNLDLVRSLGADHVIDYTQEDWRTHAARYDVVFDAVNKLPVRRGKQLRKPGGLYFNVDKDSGSGGKVSEAQLIFLKERIEAGQLTAVIDRTYALEEIVAAHRYVEQGHKVGHVVITL